MYLSGVLGKNPGGYDLSRIALKILFQEQPVICFIWLTVIDAVDYDSPSRFDPDQGNATYSRNTGGPSLRKNGNFTDR